MDILSLAKSVAGRVEAPLTDLRTVTKVLSNPRMPVLLALSKGFVEPVYRAAFLASAAGSGVLAALAVRPCDLDSLAERLGVPAEDRPLLKQWLDMGVKLGDLGRREGCYRLRSLPAKALAQGGNDALAAALEEVLRFHVPALLNGPRMLREGRRFSLDDQDGLVIARSTRVVQPLVEEAISRTLDRTSPVRLLEVGCGSGAYVRYAAGLNPRLSALAIDLQQDVADRAAANMAEWGLTDRVETRQADLRTLDVQPQFDLLTLHNNIYYFPRDERVAALRRAHDLLSPGGKLLLTTSCQGGNIGLEALNLWFGYADFGGPLPHADELTDQLEEAGFRDVEAIRLIPGEQFHAFTGTAKRAVAYA
ncbi:SAM-dependent methyltransferase [Streptomyces naganishii]|uniref:Methyltransferase n=1 Tax=Streptomyces naganishii JCM 4654 TaxID=1306179 RepID=A0A919CV35_9ACTN|nr:class I SAM-dependent methyltransferase [Streptomyces naganishii]GHD88877.1 methyltransferase [Streptomyces naganishii JCM 4654]